MDLPKISIVTPSYNQASFLEETIQSIIGQNYPNLEYIIIDGGSQDNSVEIIKKYENKIAYWISESDKGLYYALQKGFEKSSGEIMGWLNSDDLLHKNSLFTIAELFSHEKLNWIQGQPTIIDEISRTVQILPLEMWSKYRYYMKDYKWIQQESTFWNRDLWIKAGGYISTNFKLAGDLELWSRFFQISLLYTPECLIGGFRIRKSSQLSLEKIDEYESEAEEILSGIKLTTEEKANLNKIIKLKRKMKFIKKSRVLNLNFVTSRLENKIIQAYQFPAKFIFDRAEQQFKF